MTYCGPNPPVPPMGFPDWRQLSPDWPNAQHSRFWQCDGFVWHVQKQGVGPVILLLHGAGASTHSWRKLVAQLEVNFQIVTIDLPGHGFTRSPYGFKPSLQNVSQAISQLLATMNVRPDAVIGHSAGAAIAITMSDMGKISPKSLVSLNGALQPFDGPLRVAAPLLAKLAVTTGAPSWLMSKRAFRSGSIERLIMDTGSDPALIDTHLYKILISHPGHVRGTLLMMANWDLTGLEAACKRLNLPVLYLSADRDRAIRPRVAEWAAHITKQSSHLRLKKLGHLAHEENSYIVLEAFLAHWAELSGKGDASV